MNRYETRPTHPTVARWIEKDLALHASASLMTLLSSIQTTSKTKTSKGGYWQNRITMGANRDEKAQFK
jgi:hypothetical protein